MLHVERCRTREFEKLHVRIGKQRYLGYFLLGDEGPQPLPVAFLLLLNSHQLLLLLLFSLKANGRRGEGKGF